MSLRIRAGDPVIHSADLRGIREGIRKDSIASSVMNIAIEVVEAAEQGKTSFSCSYDRPEYQGKWRPYSGGMTFYYTPTNKEVEDALRIKFPDCVIRSYTDSDETVWIDIDWSA